MGSTQRNLWSDQGILQMFVKMHTATETMEDLPFKHSDVECLLEVALLRKPQSLGALIGCILKGGRFHVFVNAVLSIHVYIPCNQISTRTLNPPGIEKD